METKLKPQYYYFKGFSKAKEFADKKNAKARVHQWIVRATPDYGYVVYNLRIDNCPMLTEPYTEYILAHPFSNFDDVRIELAKVRSKGGISHELQ